MAKTILVTGISGFIAEHTALAFLSAGYNVRGTVRSAAKSDRVSETLARHTDTSKLSFVEADLLSDDGWDKAVAGIDGIAHLASPFPLAQPRDENELIRPAVDGTMRVLRHALKHNVPRVVQTSSMVAVYNGHPHDRIAPFTEDDWTILDGPGVSAYTKSKTLAEKAARAFIAGEGKAIHYASVNPGFVLGPLLDSDIGSSAQTIVMLLQGKYPGIPDIGFPVVDVRDVAKLHVAAMEAAAPSGGRYLAVSESLRFIDIARALKGGLGRDGKKVPTRKLPNWRVRIVGLFDPAVRSIVPELGKPVFVDNNKTREELGVDFISGGEAAIATGKSLIELKLL